MSPETRQKMRVLLVCMSSGGLSIDNRFIKNRKNPAALLLING
ncbi:MAG: hypothetical protein QNJ51_13865 [Calothrix sp. MO_167.B12]|nr:hypothetical protein [Calothrix sp. MO_167.B12]